MSTLSQLKNTSRPAKTSRRVGRGTGCKKGKTCGRGHKGDKSRSGYKKRHGQEGGQLPLFRKLPTRGFPGGRFRKESVSINLSLIERLFKDGETVNLQTLLEKGYGARRAPGGLKILSNGELTKKVTIEAHRFSAVARAKLEKAGVKIQELSLKK